MEIMIVNPISEQAEKKYREFYHGKEPTRLEKMNTPDWKEAIDGGELVDISYIVEGKQGKGTPKAGKTPFRHQVKGKIGKGERPKILIHPSGKAIQIVATSKSKFAVRDWYRN